MGRKNKTCRMGGAGELEFDSSDDDLYAAEDSRDSPPPIGPRTSPASRSSSNSINPTTADFASHSNTENFVSTSNRSTANSYSTNTTRSGNFLTRFNKSQDYIIIETEKVTLEPSGMQLTSGNSSSNFACVYRVQKKEICILMIQRKREIAIPLDQLRKFRYTPERNLVLAFKGKPEKSYYEFPYEDLEYRIQIPNDPTNGQLNDVTEITFTACGDKPVHRLKNEIEKWRTEKRKSAEGQQRRVSETKLANEISLESTNSNVSGWKSNLGKAESLPMDNHHNQGNNVSPVLSRHNSDTSLLDSGNHRVLHVDNEVNVIPSRDSGSALITRVFSEAILSRSSNGTPLHADIDETFNFSPKNTQVSQRTRDNNLDNQSSQLFSASLLDSEIPHQLADPNTFDLHKRHHDAKIFQNHETDTCFNSNDSSETYVFTDNFQPPEESETSNEVLLHVTCSFLTRKFAMLMPLDTTLRQLIDNIEQSRKTKISLNRLFYKNQVNDKISIFDEEDWSVAKREASITESYMITLLFT